MSLAQVITFGCRLNTFESEIIKQHVEKTGLNDCFIINSCAVTAESERQVRQKIRNLRKTFPEAKIVITGCMAQVFAKKLEKIPEIDFIIGNKEKLNYQTYEQLANGSLPKIATSSQYKVKNTDPTIITKFENRIRAFVQIQNGCNNHCAYCIISHARGNSRSVSVQGVVDQVNTFAASYPEIVLTGVNIWQYGMDLVPSVTLAMLLRRILNLSPDLQYLGLSSISPYGFSDELIDIITTEEHILPYIHLSIQSGDNEVLKMMKREPYTREDIIRLTHKLKSKRPDILIGADFITGFPGESDAQFNNTLKLINEASIDFTHIFPFSKRIGTQAYYMDNQIAKSLSKQRLHMLQEVTKIRFIKLLDSLVSKSVRFIAENEKSGKTMNYIPVQSSVPLKTGQVYNMKVISHDKQSLLVG